MKTYHQKARTYATIQKRKGVATSEICDYLRRYYKKNNDWFSSYILGWWGIYE